MRAGFGLIELCIALAITAVLCGLALPSLRNLHARIQADSLRMQLHTALSSARSTAMRRRQPIGACPSSDGVLCDINWARGWLLYPDRVKKPPPIFRPKNVFVAIQRPRSVVRAIASEGRYRTRFRPDGRNGGGNLTIRICIKDRLHSKVIVNVPGRVRSCRSRRPERCELAKEEKDRGCPRSFS